MHLARLRGPCGRRLGRLPRPLPRTHLAGVRAGRAVHLDALLARAGGARGDAGPGRLHRPVRAGLWACGGRVAARGGGDGDADGLHRRLPRDRLRRLPLPRRRRNIGVGAAAWRVRRGRRLRVRGAALPVVSAAAVWPFVHRGPVGGGRGGRRGDGAAAGLAAGGQRGRRVAARGCEVSASTGGAGGGRLDVLLERRPVDISLGRG
mmetsp:Transcript_14799/g.42445  ORF Transcript_14799/g.42445 Transcript_14799/m.42445 type:complete len:206 (-) Transcript_14799:232-849(-)